MVEPTMETLARRMDKVERGMVWIGMEEREGDHERCGNSSRLLGVLERFAALRRARKTA